MPARGSPFRASPVVDGAYYRFGNPNGQFRQVNWDRRGTWRVLTRGQYETEYSHPLVGAVAVRIEAEGYKPAISEPFKMEAGDVTFDAKLEPGAGPSGVVHGPDGRPLAGATVILSTRSLRAQLYNGKFHETGYPQVVTGPMAGSSSRPRPSHSGSSCITTKGLRKSDQKALAASPELTLHPWGRIEGIVKIGSRPAVGVQVRLSEVNQRSAPDKAMPITQRQQLRSPIPGGHYTFEHVIPAELSVSRIFALERFGFQRGHRRRANNQRSNRTRRPGWISAGRDARWSAALSFPQASSPAQFFPLNQTLERVRPEPPYPRSWMARTRDLAGRVAGNRAQAKSIPIEAKLRHERAARTAGSASRTFRPVSMRFTPRFTSPEKACPGPTDPSLRISTLRSPCPRCPAADPTSRWISARSS